MKPERTPSMRITRFLSEVRRAEVSGCRSAGDGEYAAVIELHCHPVGGGREQVLGLRAELRDGVPVIALYERTTLDADPTTHARGWDGD